MALPAPLQERAAAVRELVQEDEVRSISRRYFISNGFDGTLTSVGITVGSFLSGVPDGLTVVKVGVGAAVGLATSGVWSVWEIERAEKQAELQEIEDAMLDDLQGTQLEENQRMARVINAVMSGLGPVLGILLPVVPFLFVDVYGMLMATGLSVAIAVVDLFLFGVYMGKISGQNWLYAGIRMGLAGLVVALINVLLPSG